MRTKTLVLTALGSLSALGLMAQTSTNVYSLNAVGYINVTVPPGFSIIADQLIATGGNTLSNILGNASGTYDGSEVFQFAGTGFNSDVADSTFGINGTGWDGGGVLALNPGIGAWWFNPNTTNMTLTFVGTVPQGTNTLALSTGFNLVSSIIPQGGDVVTGLGLTNYNDQDEVFVYQPAVGATPAGYDTYIVDFTFGSTGYKNQWDPPGDPQVVVGQGFWYFANAPVSWTRNFSVNQ
jgi:hypothetical protein